MTKFLEIYKCDVCGNIVEVLKEGKGTLVCCSQDMRLLKENVEEASLEKHVPVIEQTPDGYKVSVGSELHPMQEDHYIIWIELIVDGKVYKEFLRPGKDPIAYFYVKGKVVKAREYCSLHGLWRN